MGFSGGRRIRKASSVRVSREFSVDRAQREDLQSSRMQPTHRFLPALVAAFACVTTLVSQDKPAAVPKKAAKRDK